MRPIFLTTEGIKNKKEIYDFNSSIANLTALVDRDSDLLTSAIMIALFGGQDITEPYHVELKMLIDDKEVVVDRSFANEITSQSLTIDNVPYSDNSETAVNDYIYQYLLLDKAGFQKLLFTSSDTLTNNLLTDATTRNNFVGALVDSLALNSSTFQHTLERLQASENLISSQIDSAPQVSPTQLAELKAEIVNNQSLLEQAREDLKNTRTEITLETEYDLDKGKLTEALEHESELLIKKSKIDYFSQAITRSHDTTIVSKLYNQRQKISDTIANLSKEVNETRAALAQINAKISSGNVTSKGLEADFIYANETISELRKRLCSDISSKANAPADANNLDAINAYYIKVDEEIVALSTSKREIDTEYTALTQSLIDIETKRASIIQPANYKKTVIDASVIETKLTLLDATAQDLATELEQKTKALILLQQKFGDLNAHIKDLKSREAKILASICGKYATIEQAFNADAVYKQTLYSKHILVASHETELDAIVSKIAKLDRVAENYARKLVALQTAETEITQHKAKLASRLELLNAKYLDTIAFNNVSASIDSLDYGAKCPVCSGYVTVKPQPTYKDLNLIESDVADINVAIANCDKKLYEVVGSIGQYNATSTVSAQYRDSLQETLDIKKAYIKNLLSECNVKTSSGLYDLLTATLNNSQKLFARKEQHSAIVSEIAVAIATQNLIAQDIAKLEVVTIPALTAQHKNQLDKLQVTIASYESLLPVLEGENADKLLPKLHIVEKELETLDFDYIAKLARLREISAQKVEVDELLSKLTSRSITVDVDGKPLEYYQVVTLANAKREQELVVLINKREEELDLIKLRLGGVRKVISNAIAKRDELNSHHISLTTGIDASKLMLEQIVADYETNFKALGITSQSDIDKNILDETRLNDYKNSVEEYNNELAATQELIAMLTDDVKRKQEFSDRLADNIELEKQLEDISTELSRKIAEDMALRANLKAQAHINLNYNENQTRIKSRIKATTELTDIVEDELLQPNKLVGQILMRANKKLADISKGRLKLELLNDVVTVVNANLKAITLERLSSIDKSLVGIAISSVFTKTIQDITGGCYPTTTLILSSAFENKETAIAIGVLASQEDLIIITPTNYILKQLAKTI